LGAAQSPPSLPHQDQRRLQAGVAHQEQLGVLRGAAVLPRITISQLPSSLAPWHQHGTIRALAAADLL